MSILTFWRKKPQAETVSERAKKIAEAASALRRKTSDRAMRERMLADTAQEIEHHRIELAKAQREEREAMAALEAAVRGEGDGA